MRFQYQSIQEANRNKIHTLRADVAAAFREHDLEVELYEELGLSDPAFTTSFRIPPPSLRHQARGGRAGLQL